MKSFVLVDHWPDEGVVEFGRSEEGGEANVLILGELEDLDHELGGELGNVAQIIRVAQGAQGGR